MRTLREFGRIVSVCTVAGLCLLNLGCEALNSRSKRGEGVPADGLLGAKATALEHAMDSMSPEDRFYSPDAEYQAYGIMDPDETHTKALLALLKNRRPPVVNATKLYSRSSNSQWFESRPAMRWTAAAAKDPENPIRVKVLVGWMHSQLIYAFTEYTIDYDGKGWAIVDFVAVDVPADR